MEELLALALEDPDRGRAWAEEVLVGDSDPVRRSYAHQCLGIVHRERGDHGAALRELRAALRDARRSSVLDRERDVRATLGATLVFAGRTRSGLLQLERAAAGATGGLGARIGMRRAGILVLLGRDAEAVPVLRASRDALVLTGDAVWEARARIWLGDLELRRGHLDVAEEETRCAEEILDREGAQLERLTAIENRADIAIARGDLATGLRIHAEVAARYRSLGRQVRYAGTATRARAYLSAGLAREAVELLDHFLAQREIPAVDQAELHLLHASALLAMGDAVPALAEARTARTLFGRQHRPWHRARAELAEFQARDLARAPSSRVRAVALAGQLHAERAHEAPSALTLAGRLSTGEQRRELWAQAASYRHHPNALVRAGAWHARALAREETHDRGGVLRAAAAGLDAIDEHRRLIGSSELRALATTHGRELTAIALRHAATDARTLLRWSERTRATALAQPPATSDAATIPASLAALRDNGRQLAEARQEGAPTEELERERRRLERAVRAESHTLSATTAAQQRPASVEEILAATGETCLVELVDVDGVLHVVLAHAGKVRRRVAGATSEIAALLGPAAMLLRRAARGRPADTTSLGKALQEAVLGDAAALLPDTPVVLAPPARLHGLAWSLLPTLHDRPFAVVPSAGQWLRARASTPPDPASTVLVAGPALASGGAEVPVLAGRHPDAVLLDGPRATLDAVLAHLDGAGLVHLAAHGRFRADSPLFSALDLADGPLTVHDLERVPRAPYRVVLSACESGVLAPVGAEELLGLAAALFSLGTAGLVCSVGEVNDAATAALMVDLHAALAVGSDPATALCEVRRRAAGDPVAAGTAAAFLALGV
ncbi:CHAT domain-containing protein [Nocardioides daeguensis]|uniref:CHAT domain-containing protein n=1 Tax=Nocardioides daeguensis TaxID=908359 RepID=A0ABP6VF60_9ACTN|nr:CHAT domain-containing protein [Nocardioides daeguensis]MBV6728872.1 CHAT domain-containing protein [Nocardioides daeguensis]MCR1773393.1 CHAT domain-containing protein [Nocardioides daeguensis]